MKNKFLFLSLILILILGCFNSDDNKEFIIDKPNLEEHYLKLENNIPKDYFAQEIITSTDVPLTHKDQYYEIQNNLNSIIG